VPEGQGHASDCFTAVTERLREDHMPQLLIDTFCHHYTRLLSGGQILLGMDDIRPVSEVQDSQHLERYAPAGQEALSRTVLFKLNGGLGTSMGLAKAKSLLPVKDGLSFLDIIVRQVDVLRKKSDSNLPLVLMNSFSTQNDTLQALEAYPELAAGQPDIPTEFLQHRVPKIRQDNFKPAHHPSDPELEWCPPGHGDFYTALITSGVLDNLLAAGIEYGFVSNADNLGATLDLSILGYFASENIPFMMEVTDRTEADRKGGHLAESKDNHLILRERAQCPENEIDDFQDITRYRFFNTNNLWINLRRLSEAMKASDNILELPLMANQKTVDPRDPESTPVYQLETAMGAAISLFPKARALRVPRTRFAPVKTTNDLLALRSDAYILTSDMHVVINPERTIGTPVIDLDKHYYALIDDFDHAFEEGIPSLLQCSHLTIEGQIKFDGPILLAGNVTMRNRLHRTIYIPPGTIFRSLGKTTSLE